MSYELPPRLHGESGRDLAALRDYLVRIVQELPEGSRDDVGIVPYTGSSKNAVGAVAHNGPQTTADLAASALPLNAKNLRALIVQTADRQRADKAELLTAIDSVEGTTLLHIDSSRGTVFKHSAVETVLRVVLYRGGQRITDLSALHAAFGAGAYLQWSWQRPAEDRFGLIAADDARLSDGGFTFTLTPADVDARVTLACQLITSD